MNSYTEMTPTGGIEVDPAKLYKSERVQAQLAAARELAEALGIGAKLAPEHIWEDE